MHATSRQKHTTRLVATNLLIVLLFAAGCAPGSGGKVVDIEKVGEPESTRTVTADGTLEATRTADIQAEAGGRVISVDVLDGQTVSPGQAIVRLDASGLEAQLEALESDGGGGGSSSGGAVTDTADLEKAFEAINGIAAQRTANLVQQIALLDPSVLALPSPTDPVASCTPGPMFDPATCAGVLPLQQDILAIQQSAAEYQTQVSTDFQGSLIAAAANFALASALGSAGGGSGQLDAQEAGLRTQIDAMDLTTPIAGQVALEAPSGGGNAQIAALGGGASGSSATLQVGTLVSPGAKVATVYDTASLRVEAAVDEADVPLVKTGQTASVTVDAYPGQELQGRVTSVALNPATGESGGVSYQVNVDVPAEDLPGWRPGMTATVDIEVEQPTPGIELPASAVVTREGKDYVFILDGDTARRTEVAKVQGGDGFVVVTSGLEPGDIVVTSGAADLEDGDKVSTEAPE